MMLETFKAQAEGEGTCTKVTIPETDWTLHLDEPTEDGGTNIGPNPMQYLTACLAGCQNEQAQVVASELSLTIPKIDINVEIDLDLSGFMGESDRSDDCYKSVRLEAVVHGEVTDDQVKTLGQKVDARCPILVLLRQGGAKVESSWKTVK